MAALIHKHSLPEQPASQTTKWDSIPACGEGDVNINKHLCAMYGSCVASDIIVSDCTQRVEASESRKMELCDLPCSEHPTISTSSDIFNCAVIICIDRGITS